MPDAVDRYLEALAAQDFTRLGATLAPDLIRVGPYGDVVEGGTAYRDFLANLVPTLPGYRLEVERVERTPEATWVQLAETITSRRGRRLRTEEALRFALDAEGRIAGIRVYTQEPREG